jgi:hypothetical protein
MDGWVIVGLEDDKPADHMPPGRETEAMPAGGCP